MEEVAENARRNPLPATSGDAQGTDGNIVVPMLIVALLVAIILGVAVAVCRKRRAGKSAGGNRAKSHKAAADLEQIAAYETINNDGVETNDSLTESSLN